MTHETRPETAPAADDIRIAIVVNPALAPGFMANTVAAISIGLGASRPALGAQQLTDSTGRTIDVSANRPVPILQADADTVRAITLRALATVDDGDNAGAGGIIVPFPAFARAMHVYAEYVATFPSRDLGAEAIDGVGLAGPARWVRSLTGALKLLR